MTDLLRGRVGIVTGAGRGIGRQIATALAAEGMSLMVLARTGTEVRSLAEELTASYDVHVFPAAVDVADPAAIERVVQHAEQQLGPIDLLVNNAAQIEKAERPFWEADLDEMWRVVETNLRGPMLLIHAVLPAMVGRGHGHVVNVVSRARAATATGTYTGYAVSKRALSVLTQSLAGPLTGTGVVAVDLLPGLVHSRMTDGMAVWQDRDDLQWDDAADSARLVVAIATGRYDDAAGTVLNAPELAGS